ncbi:hypothetical protein [Actinomadura violacea]|uniref:Tyr recombinase domain-containing protein n=1 Tax=Actinomadura violacea TaxID=2819934 RepID=A0ABS3S955_9ACTN|nr:hypothetical protein [Actinomadura violacea]MBO2465538.1 hypothetical protein [Actinomadura violacea]
MLRGHRRRRTETGQRNQRQALMGRRSELAALDAGDVAETPEGLEVTIRMSKTDQDAAGETIAIPRDAHPITDPVAAWRDWTALLAARGIAGGRLLRSVDRHGRIGASITGDAINRAVRRLALAADVPDAASYTAHSLRAGGATIAYRGPGVSHRPALPVGARFSGAARLHPRGRPLARQRDAQRRALGRGRLQRPGGRAARGCGCSASR